jgi:hypothetical protein
VELQVEHGRRHCAPQPNVKGLLNTSLRPWNGATPYTKVVLEDSLAGKTEFLEPLVAKLSAPHWQPSLERQSKYHYSSSESLPLRG